MENQELGEGMFLAETMTKVQADYTITSFVNTTNETVEIDVPVLRVTELR